MTLENPPELTTKLPIQQVCVETRTQLKSEQRIWIKDLDLE